MITERKEAVRAFIEELLETEELKGDNIVLFGEPVQPIDRSGPLPMSPWGGRIIPEVEALRATHQTLKNQLGPDRSLHIKGVPLYHIYNDNPETADPNYWTVGERYFLDMIPDETRIKDVKLSFEKVALLFILIGEPRVWHTPITEYDDNNRIITVVKEEGEGRRPLVVKDHLIWSPFTSKEDIVEYYKKQIEAMRKMLGNPDEGSKEHWSR